MSYDQNTDADYRGKAEPDPVADTQGAAGLTPPVNWWLLSPEEKRRHLARVTNFTLRLAQSYKLGSEIIVPCWHKHEEMVQELLALCQYRNDQQFIASQTPGAAIDFHEKFAVWRQRMRQWVQEAGCKANEHVDKAPPPWTIPDSEAYRLAEGSRIDWVTALEASSTQTLHNGTGLSKLV